jgi:hypothetical protein
MRILKGNIMLLVVVLLSIFLLFLLSGFIFWYKLQFVLTSSTPLEDLIIDAKNNQSIEIKQTPPVSKITIPVKTNERKETIIELVKSSDSIQYFEGGGGFTPTKKYRIKVLPGWKVTKIQYLRDGETPDPAHENVFITNETFPDYFIRIAQGGFSGYRCAYPGGTLREDTNDSMYKDYVNIVDSDGHKFRRAVRDGFDYEETTQEYDICEYRYEARDYFLPTVTYELIKFHTPKILDKNILHEMDEMLASIKNIGKTVKD